MITGLMDKDVLSRRLIGRTLGVQTNAYKLAVYKHPEADTLSKFASFKNVKCSTFSDVVKHLPNHDCIITDWYTPNEYKYLAARYNSIITVRYNSMFRNINSSTDIPKHGLNNWATEYLVIPHTLDGSEFETAIKYYPFYKDYVLCDHL